MSRQLYLRSRFTLLGRSALILSLAFFGASARQLCTAQENLSLQFVTAFSTDADVNQFRTPCQHLRDIVHPSANHPGEERPAVCDSVLNVVAGKTDRTPPAAHLPIKAGKLAVDSNQRVVITEPETRIVHVLDFANRKYLRIDVARGNRMGSPFVVAVDAGNNIYVTDMERGRIAVYNPDGKFLKYIGKFKDEGLFQAPRAIAIDRASGRIYLADTARNFILILDLNGKVLAQVGKRGGGEGPAEFKQPTDIAIYGSEVFVLDRANSRVQVLDLDGKFRRQFKLSGAGAEGNGIAFDSQGRMFVTAVQWIEAFNQEGKLLFRFGQAGEKQGEFQDPKGICTDSKDRVYVVDSGNHRIQVFQTTDHPKSNSKIEAAR